MKKITRIPFSFPRLIIATQLRSSFAAQKQTTISSSGQRLRRRRPSFPKKSPTTALEWFPLRAFLLADYEILVFEGIRIRALFSGHHVMQLLPLLCLSHLNYFLLSFLRIAMGVCKYPALILCSFEASTVSLQIVFLPLLAFEAAILVDNFRMCKTLLPGEKDSVSYDAIWDTLPRLLPRSNLSHSTPRAEFTEHDVSDCLPFPMLEEQPQ